MTTPSGPRQTGRARTVTGSGSRALPVARAGSTSARLRLPTRRARWLRWLARLAEIATVVVAFGGLVLWCSVPDPARLADENPTSTAFIDLRRVEAASAGKPFRLEWRWRPIGKISRYLRAAIIEAEDYKFFRHNGVDWSAVEDALEANLDKGSLAVGGSTITQQLAKNLYLSPNRSMLRKLREMLIAFSLEDHLSKQRILELYLNVVEWGDGVFGAEAAARHWFGHSAQSLSPAEAARLAIALPNPITRAPDVHSAELTRKAVRIIHLLRMQSLIDATQEREALDQVGARDEKVVPMRPRPGQPGPGPEPGQPTRPDPGQPDTTRPDPGPPDTTRPDPAQPDTARPDPGQPDTTRPDPGQPEPPG
jgi:monofunctional biosynthetic peptidoglycan transglycosylase